MPNIKPTINVNPNVYEAVKAVTYDGYTTSPKVSNSEAADVERAIAEDGNVDAGEAQLLDAMRSGTSFRVSAQGQAPYDVDASLLTFDKGKIADVNAGTRVAIDGDGDLHALPSTVPAQGKAGRPSDVYVDQSQTGGTATWEQARARMLNPNGWEATADANTYVDRSASFQVTDASGNSVSRPPAVGDYLKINLPGSPLGADWVRVEAIQDNPNEVSVRVRPSKDPTSSSNATEHFFTSAATNTFTLRREGDNISFQVNGRNEVANGAYGTAVDLGGSIGMQDDQWNNLGAGILR
ncbi:MAG: hypothetical protein ACO1RX_06400 [Candidatus Sericytochromatia bacterium]